MRVADLVARTGLTAREVAAAAAKAQVAAVGEWYVDRGWMQSAREQLAKTVREFHRANPLLPGIARQDLRGAVPALLFDALLADSKDLVGEGEVVRARSHQLVLKEDEEQARAKIEQAFEAAGLTVPSLTEVLAESGGCGSRTSWCFSGRRWSSFVRCSAGGGGNGSRCRRSRSGRACRGSTRFRC